MQVQKLPVPRGKWTCMAKSSMALVPMQILTVISLGCDTATCLFPVLLLSAAAALKPLQSCPSLCDPIDGSLPGSPVPGILQAGTLEWVAISFSNAWKWKVKVKSLSRVRPSATPWTAAYQAPPSMGVSTRGLEWGAIAFSLLLSNHVQKVAQW